ncbi:hypothetical protein ON010_g9246 [Phytophthora cinnamomi]|nr:hypothetical protein ON010_g9246 [Phytophthora cinnamomi]
MTSTTDCSCGRQLSYYLGLSPAKQVGFDAIELGCGIVLPSSLAGLCGATKVYLTDRANFADVQLNAEANIKFNDLQGRAEFIPLTWVNMHVLDDIIAVFKTVKGILAANCFYQSEGKHFDNSQNGLFRLTLEYVLP